MFKRDLFAATLKDAIDQRGLSLRQAANESRVSASTLSRLLAHKEPDMDTFTRLCAWLKLSPAIFFEQAGKATEIAPRILACAAIQSDSTLSEVAREKLVELIKIAYDCLATQ